MQNNLFVENTQILLAGRVYTRIVRVKRHRFAPSVLNQNDTVLLSFINQIFLPKIHFTPLLKKNFQKPLKTLSPFSPSLAKCHRGSTMATSRRRRLPPSAVAGVHWKKAILAISPPLTRF